MKKELYHYDNITAFNKQRYDHILNANNVSGDEIAIKDKDTEEEEFFYPLKKNKINYLLPSQYIDELPLKIINDYKSSWRSKAYKMITSIKSIKIIGKKTMSYKQMIDNFIPYAHIVPEEFKVWKIICNVAYMSRINIRAISYPGWLKDSPLVILAMLRGDVTTLNKPTFAKLKYVLAGNNKILGMNEVQNIKSEEKYPLAKYYEDVGDFKPKFVSDSRATGHTREECSIINHSSMTFYNFPKKDTETLFDDVFDPKILSRIFPILLSGGNHDETACLETFGLINSEFTEEDYDEMTAYLKNHVYYEENYKELLKAKAWNNPHSFRNTRWQRNYDTICQGLKLYSDDEREFIRLERVFYSMHRNYMDYIANWKMTEEQRIGTTQIAKKDEITDLTKF